MVRSLCASHQQLQGVPDSAASDDASGTRYSVGINGIQLKDLYILHLVQYGKTFQVILAYTPCTVIFGKSFPNPDVPIIDLRGEPTSTQVSCHYGTRATHYGDPSLHTQVNLANRLYNSPQVSRGIYCMRIAL